MATSGVTGTLAASLKDVNSWLVQRFKLGINRQCIMQLLYSSYHSMTECHIVPTYLLTCLLKSNPIQEYVRVKCTTTPARPVHSYQLHLQASPTSNSFGAAGQNYSDYCSAGKLYIIVTYNSSADRITLGGYAKWLCKKSHFSCNNVSVFRLFFHFSAEKQIFLFHFLFLVEKMNMHFQYILFFG